MNIVTSICIDPHDESYNYQLYYLNYQEKRATYWKCAFTFFATARRTVPASNLILFTNDKNPVIFNHEDVKKVLDDLNVEVRILDNHFNPPKGFSNYLKNNLYKFDVIQQLSKEKQPSVLLDSDCFWNKKDPNLEKTISEGKVLLYAMYDKLDPHDRSPNNISEHDLGELFRKIDPDYSVVFPRFYGGEIISGDPSIFERISEEFSDIYSKILNEYDKPPQFYNGKTIMDGNETIGNYIFNKIFKPEEIINGRKYIKRIWTTNNITVESESVEKTIWHMISEKDKGIPILFNQALKQDSTFWKIPVVDFASYLGSYLGVPERIYDYDKPAFIRTILPRVKNKLNIYKRMILSDHP